MLHVLTPDFDGVLVKRWRFPIRWRGYPWSQIISVLRARAPISARHCYGCFKRGGGGGRSPSPMALVALAVPVKEHMGAHRANSCVMLALIISPVPRLNIGVRCPRECTP